MASFSNGSSDIKVFLKASPICSSSLNLLTNSPEYSCTVSPKPANPVLRIELTTNPKGDFFINLSRPVMS